MTKTIESDLCDACGLKVHEHEISGNELCDDCKRIADVLHNNPKIISRIAKLTKLNTDPEKLLGKEETKNFTGLPEVLNAVRFRARDRDMNKWYLSVSEINGEPVEIFASTAFDRDQHLQSRISNLTTITRLISLILRHVFLGEVLTLEKTLKQLHRSSRQQNDLPDMLTRVLSNYCQTGKQQKDQGIEEKQ